MRLQKANHDHKGSGSRCFNVRATNRLARHYTGSKALARGRTHPKSPLALLFRPACTCTTDSTIDYVWTMRLKYMYVEYAYTGRRTRAHMGTRARHTL